MMSADDTGPYARRAAPSEDRLRLLPSPSINRPFRAGPVGAGPDGAGSTVAVEPGSRRIIRSPESERGTATVLARGLRWILAGPPPAGALGGAGAASTTRGLEPRRSPRHVQRRPARRRCGGAVDATWMIGAAASTSRSTCSYIWSTRVSRWPRRTRQPEPDDHAA